MAARPPRPPQPAWLRTASPPPSLARARNARVAAPRTGPASPCGQRLVAAGAATTVARPEAPDGTQACPRCGTHNRAGVAFCQNCGANLRAAEQGYVPPAVAATGSATGAAAATQGQERAGHAVLGPIVLLVGALGMATGWLLPFAEATGSLSSMYDRSFGDPAGYGIAFWTAYDSISGLAAQAYFGSRHRCRSWSPCWCSWPGPAC
jgi:hypothetical protein